MKSETSALHSQAERAGIVPDLLGGTLARDLYCLLLRNLYEIYAALEPALTRHAQHPFIAPVWFAGLRRCDALADDLRTLHGEQWRRNLPVESACLAYVARLREIDSIHPERLAAHAYVRYLGDLSGGQAIGRIVAAAYHLHGDAGTRAYAFAEPGAAVLSRRFREGLDAVPENEALADGIVAEAKLSFGLHIRLFEELAMLGAGMDVRGKRSGAAR